MNEVMKQLFHETLFVFSFDVNFILLINTTCCFFVISLTTYTHWLLKCPVMSTELQSMWEKAVTAYFKTLAHHSSG
jgi:hypothetical protein